MFFAGRNVLLLYLCAVYLKNQLRYRGWETSIVLFDQGLHFCWAARHIESVEECFRVLTNRISTQTLCILTLPAMSPSNRCSNPKDAEKYIFICICIYVHMNYQSTKQMIRVHVSTGESLKSLPLLISSMSSLSSPASALSPGRKISC